MANIKTEDRPWLFFIDTNILLDFYSQGGEGAKKQLKLIEKHKDKLISSFHVRAEYLKNRQGVIEAAVSGLPPKMTLNRPPVLADRSIASTLSKAQRDMNAELKKIKKIFTDVLEKPQTHDDVFRSLLKIWKKKQGYYLAKDGSDWEIVFNLAKERHAMGYPPNKSDSKRLGDAIHWEWIIHCANSADVGPNIIIVTRDEDWGIVNVANPILDDYLKFEFAERVGRQRRIEITPDLSVALKKFNQVDAQAAEKVEAEEKKVASKTVERRLGDYDAMQAFRVSQHLRNLLAHNASLNSLENLNLTSQSLKELQERLRLLSFYRTNFGADGENDSSETDE